MWRNIRLRVACSFMVLSLGGLFGGGSTADELVTLVAQADEPAAGDAADDPAGANADNKAQGGDQAESAKAKSDGGMSYVAWWLRSSGVIGIFILGLSIYFVATVVRLFVELRPDVAAPPDVVQHLEELLDKRDFPAVYRVADESETFIGRTLATGLAELPGGLGEARIAMERMGDAEMIELEKKASMLAVLGTLGPMIGLIGTLQGMISSFSVIARSDVQLKASEVAGGISQALVLTFEGVALSIPAIYFYAVFRNRVATISSSTMITADHLLRRFAQAMRAKGHGAGTPNAPLPPDAGPGRQK